MFEVLSHIWARLGRRVVVERLRHSLLAPGFLHTGRGGSKPPGSPGWRPLPSSKAFGLQQPTGYHLFTIHSYLLPSPTQVGDAGRVREPTYRYKPRAVLSGGIAARPRSFRFISVSLPGRFGNQRIGTGSVRHCPAALPPPYVFPSGRRGLDLFFSHSQGIMHW